MKTINIKPVRGAHKTYPQWHAIAEELNDRFEEFHTDLRNKGYRINAANIAEKDNKLFWILLSADGSYELEHYATIVEKSNNRKGLFV